MQETNIGWTNYSGNILRYRDEDGNIVHACVRVSAGCARCYSCALAGRWGRKGKDFTAENMKPLTPFFDEDGAMKILRSRKISGQRVFLNDMTDWMGPWVSNEIIDKTLVLIALRPTVTFQTLTKHADRQRDYFLGLGDAETASERIEVAAGKLGLTEEAQCQIANSLHDQLGDEWNTGWPMRNLHLGVSVEDQKNADKRIPCLLQTPAAVRWISAEPLLGPLDLSRVTVGDNRVDYDPLRGKEIPGPYCRDRIRWIVVGGESGANHRRMDIGWLTDVVQQCKAASVPVFVKQDSGPKPGQQGRIPDDYWLKQFPREIT